MSSDSDSDRDAGSGQEDEVDSEEMEELDEEDQPPQKRTRKSKSKFDPRSFVIDEAEVDEDDDDEDSTGGDDLGLVDEAAEAAETEREFENRLRFENERWNADEDRFDPEDEEALESYYRERYSRTATSDRFGEGSQMTDEISQQSNLPGVKDPNLWVVRCRMGEEKQVVLGLMRKMIAYQNTDEPLQIKSVIAKDSLKGYIYIEAFKQTHVKQAIEGMSALALGKYNQQMVPIGEMTDVLRVVKDTSSLRIGQWVRLKTGMYRDDLARVYEVRDSMNQVDLVLVPRIDYSRKRGVLRNQDRDGDQSEQRRRRFKKFPQALFDQARIRELGGETSREGDLFIFEGNHYDMKGFLRKTFNINAVISEGVKPTLSELEKFQATPDTVGLESMSAGRPGEEVAHNFAPGDLVEVCEGELKNLQGKVIRIEGDEITILPNHDDLKDPLPFPSGELRKHFNPGNHVKAIGGRFEGDTGLVIRVDENVAIVLSDLTFSEFKVAVKDLQLCAETSTGVDQAGHYQFGDLVQIDPQTVGVIIRLEKEHFCLLTMHDKVIRVKQNALLRRRDNRHAQALDTDGHPIQPKDVVKIAEGPHSGYQGEVRHIFRSWAFVYCRMHSENGGIVVARARHLQLAGGGAGRSLSSGDHQRVAQPFSSPAHPLSGGGGVGGVGVVSGGDGGRSPAPHGGGGFGRGRGRGVPGGPDRSLIGQTVRITQGQFKNHVGIIKDVMDNTVRLELHSQYKIITVDKSRVMPVDGHRQARPSASTYGRTPLHGAQTPGYGASSARTPMYGLGGQTPMHDGSRTPHYGSMTPRADGGATPGHPGSAWDPTAGTTPRHRYPDTFEYDYETESPSVSSGAPLTPTARGVNEASPMSGSDFSPSPAPGYSPLTPGMAPFTPHTPGGALLHQADGVDWIAPDIVVTVKPTCEDESLRNLEGHVRSVSGHQASVYLPSEKKVVAVPPQHLLPRLPESGDRVKVIAGEDKNQTGQCLSVDTNEGVVKITEGPLKLLNLSLLAKMVEPREAAG